MNLGYDGEGFGLALDLERVMEVPQRWVGQVRNRRRLERNNLAYFIPKAHQTRYLLNLLIHFQQQRKGVYECIRMTMDSSLMYDRTEQRELKRIGGNALSARLVLSVEDRVVKEEEAPCLPILAAHLEQITFANEMPTRCNQLIRLNVSSFDKWNQMDTSIS